LRLLTNRSDGQFRCLCPKLESLGLFSCISCLEGVFADMVESRRKDDADQGPDPSQVPVARLQQVSLTNFRTRQDILRLKQLAKEGLKLHLV
jgi:hypothetical protein